MKPHVRELRLLLELKKRREGNFVAEPSLCHQKIFFLIVK